MSRRKPQSPLTAIIEFFMAAPIAQAQSGLEAAQAVVSARVKTAAPLTANVPARRQRIAHPPVVPANANPPATPPPTPPARQRAVRSDAGKPRNAAAAPAVPVRHRRPPITPAVAAAAEPLPDSYVPPEAEDAEI